MWKFYFTILPLFLLGGSELGLNSGLVKQSKKLLLIMKKVLRRKHCMLAVVRRTQKFFAPPHTPFPGARDCQNLISCRWSLPLPIDPVWWRLMHANSSYRGNRPTHTPTHKHHLPTGPPQTGPITIHCAARLSAQCYNSSNYRAPCGYRRACRSRASM